MPNRFAGDLYEKLYVAEQKQLALRDQTGPTSTVAGTPQTAASRSMQQTGVADGAFSAQLAQDPVARKKALDATNNAARFYGNWPGFSAGPVA